MGKVENLPSRKIKAFKGRPAIIMITRMEPTERYVLWIIANDKTAFNPLYHGQFMASSEDLRKPDSNLFKSLKILTSLEQRGYVNQDEEMNFSITFSGYIHRVLTHPKWILIQLLLAGIIGFIGGYIAGGLNKSDSSKQGSIKEAKEKPDSTISDSTPKPVYHIQPSKVADSSSVLPFDMTKTKNDTTTAKGW